MSVHDPIADALTIIRNGCRAKKESVTIPFSTKMENILAILKKEGYINDFKKVEVKDKNFFRIEIDLKYYEGGFYKLLPFFSLFLAICIAGIYFGNLFFGTNSLSVLFELQNKEEQISKEVKNLMNENAKLQKELFELKGLEPQ